MAESTISKSRFVIGVRCERGGVSWQGLRQMLDDFGKDTLTYEKLWKAVGHVCDPITDEECYNFFKAARYKTD